AARLLTESKVPPNKRQEVTYTLAALNARLKKPEEAFKKLYRVLRFGFRDPKRLAGDPAFANVRGDKRFDAIVKKAGENARRFWEDSQPKGTPVEIEFAYTAPELLEELKRGIEKGGDPFAYEFTGPDGRHFPDVNDPAKFRIVFVWAYWSQAANSMLDYFPRLEKKYKAKGLTCVLAAANLYGTDVFERDTFNYLLEQGIKLRWDHIDRNRMRESFQAESVPLTFFLNNKGRLVLFCPGVMRYEDMELLVTSWLRDTELGERRKRRDELLRNSAKKQAKEKADPQKPGDGKSSGESPEGDEKGKSPKSDANPK
ncbi:MAG: hypothetical protein AAF517_24895, partial [Planctomycetota bacterium]